MINRISFKVKLFILILIVIIVPITFTIGILYQRSKHITIMQISNVVVNSLNFTINYFESSLNFIVAMSEQILEEETIATTARIETPLSGQEITTVNMAIRKSLNVYVERIKALSSSFGFDSFYLYFPGQNLLLDSKTTYYADINTQNIDFLKHEGRKPWFITSAVNYYTLNNIRNRYEHDKLLTFVNEIKDDRGRVTASLAANIRSQFLNEFYNEVEKGISGNFMIIDNEGSYIANSDAELTNRNPEIYEKIDGMIADTKRTEGIIQIKINGRNNFIIYSVSAHTGWKYIVAIPAIDIFGKIYSRHWYFAVAVIIIVLLVIPFCYVVTGILYRPLEKLVRAMQKIENGNIKVRISDQRKDEYQKVYTGFNNMAEKLANPIEDLSNEKSLKKEAEINLLQAQINPHFLYNTLDSIYSIAMVYKIEKISQITAALSRFFKVSLSGGKSDVPLKEALKIVESYLIIQNIRFNNKINYEISIPDVYLEMIVPKLLLQPIVENSVYHGMERKKGKGHLSISCSVNENVFYIYIEDDGIGINGEKLAVLKKSIYSDTVDDSRSFALKNLNKQIILKYGQGYGLNIESSQGVGTVVTVSMPVAYTECIKAG
jgi:two-component system sensor histidine kinase YesM